MAVSFASRLTSEAGRRWGFAVCIQGVPVVGVSGQRDRSIPVPVNVLELAWSYTDTPTEVEITTIDRAKKTIDPVQRRMVGGSLTVGLLDDDGGTLAALFAPRSRHIARLAEDLSETATPAALDVTSVAQIAEPAPYTFLYSGAETIAIDARVSSTEVSVGKRGVFGSRPHAHTSGAPLYAVPPSWLGRRVKLIGFFIEDDGSINEDTAALLDTFRLEEPPTFTGPERWELRASHLSDEFAEKKMGVGLADVQSFFRIVPRTAGQRSFVAPYGTAPFTQGSYPTYIRLLGGDEASAIGTGAERASVHQITDLDVGRVGFMAANEVEGGLIPDPPESARHIAILRNGSPGVLAAIALSSRLGDGTLGTYDVLPGVESTMAGGPEWFFGAGLLSDEIDIDAFIDVGWAAPWWSYVIDDEISVVDFLRDFCIVTESFWFVTAAGKLSVRTMQGRTPTSSATIIDVIGPEEGGVDPLPVFDESGVLPRVRIQCSYNTIMQEFEESITIVDVEMARRYPNRQDVFEISSRAVHITPHRRRAPRVALPQITVAQMEATLRRLMVADRRGRAIVTVATHLDAMTLDLGDFVDLTVDIPDLAGSTINGQRARVIGTLPVIERGRGVLLLDLQLVERSYAIAPAAVIASVAGTTLTLRTTGPEVASSTAPARMFGTDWLLRIHDISGGTSELVFGTVTGDTTVELGALPAFAIENGVDYITVADQADRTFADANTSGLTPDDFTYQMPDDEVDGANEFTTRWG